jgi:hypothetical protein
MRALTVNAETLETTLIDIPRLNALAQIQLEVGGYIEAVRLDKFDFYLNEEGKMIGLPLNEVGTLLWESVYGQTDVIMGNIVVVGKPDDEGYETELSLESAQEIQNIAITLQVTRFGNALMARGN